MQISGEHKNAATHGRSVQTTVTAPSQKLNLKPHTKGSVINEFCEVTDINYYLLDYVIDIHKTKLRCKFQEFPYHSNVNVQNSKREGDPLKLVELKGYEYVLKNVPATQKVTGYEINVSFGADEPL